MNNYIMTTLELNKTYTFNLGDMSHCGQSHEEMIEHYKSNSSPLSFLVEKKLEKWFDNLTYDPTRVKLFDENNVNSDILKMIWKYNVDVRKENDWQKIEGAVCQEQDQ